MSFVGDNNKDIDPSFSQDGDEFQLESAPSNQVASSPLPLPPNLFPQSPIPAQFHPTSSSSPFSTNEQKVSSPFSTNELPPIPSSPFATNDTSKSASSPFNTNDSHKSAASVGQSGKKDDFESPAYLQWKEEHEKSVQDKAAKATERQARARETAKQELKKLQEERASLIERNKKRNREQEKVTQEKKEKTAKKEGSDWEQVVALIDFHHSKAPKVKPNPTASNPNPTELKTNIPKRDTSRMKEILLKLKQAH